MSDKQDEYFMIHQARYEKILDSLSKFPPSKILDVGCYPYHLGNALEKMGHDVYGIASAHEPVHSQKVKICNIESDIFPFKDNFFDIVIFTEVLEHLPQSPAHALLQMHRVTMPDGHLLITTPNIARSINRIKLLLGQSIAYPLSQVLENTNIYHRHNREYTMDELVELMKFAGWNIEKTEYFVSYTPMRKRVKSEPLPIQAVKWANYLLMSVLPSWRDTLFVLAKK